MDVCSGLGIFTKWRRVSPRANKRHKTQDKDTRQDTRLDTGPRHRTKTETQFQKAAIHHIS